MRLALALASATVVVVATLIAACDADDAGSANGRTDAGVSGADATAASAAGDASGSSEAGSSDAAGSNSPDAGADSAVADARIAFVTHGLHTGNLVSILQGDKDCDADANLPGRTFTAWLSTGTVFAINRIGQGPWRTAGGITITRARFTGIDHDAQGRAVTGKAWTGTNSVGLSADGHDCSDWGSDATTGMAGSIGGDVMTWTASGIESCANTFHLYCFENDD